MESGSIQAAEIRGEGIDFLHDYEEFSITLIEKGYTTKLPPKIDNPPLPTSLKEEHIQWKHLARDPQNMKMYSDIIIEQEKRVFTERVTDPETTVGTCHSLTPCLV